MKAVQQKRQARLVQQVRQKRLLRQERLARQMGAEKPMITKRKTEMDSKTAAICLTLGFVLIFLTTLLTADPHNSVSHAWPLEEDVASYDAYVQQADAWLKGQLFLDVEPDPALLAMKNPYDSFKRAELQVPFLFDRALYEGKYYSYFGVAPLLLLYFPSYFLSGRFPSYLFSSGLLAMTSVPLLLMALHGLFSYFQLRYRRGDFVCLYLGLLASSLIPYALRCSDRYFVPVQTAMFALCWFLASSFKALREDTPPGRSALHFFSAGTALIVILQSRPHLLLFAALFGAPLYLRHLFRRELSFKLRLLQVLSFALPLLLGFGLTFYYNALRFSGPLDFGASSQLTVLDVHTYQLRPAWLLPAWKSTFFHKIKGVAEYPYFEITAFTDPLEPLLYRGPVMGLMCIPLNWLIILAPFLSLLLFPAESRREKQNKQGSWAEPWSLTFVLPAAAGLLSLLFLAWFEFCMAGSLMRYNCDLSLPLSFLAAFLSVPLLAAESGPSLVRPARDENFSLSAALVSLLSLVSLIFVIIMPRV